MNSTISIYWRVLEGVVMMVGGRIRRWSGSSPRAVAGLSRDDVCISAPTIHPPRPSFLLASQPCRGTRRPQYGNKESMESGPLIMPPTMDFGGKMAVPRACCVGVCTSQ